MKGSPYLKGQTRRREKVLASACGAGPAATSSARPGRGSRWASPSVAAANSSSCPASQKLRRFGAAGPTRLHQAVHRPAVRPDVRASDPNRPFRILVRHRRRGLNRLNQMPGDDQVTRFALVPDSTAIQAVKRPPAGRNRIRHKGVLDLRYVRRLGDHRRCTSIARRRGRWRSW